VTAPGFGESSRATVDEVSAMFDDLKRKTDAYWALVDARKAAEAAFTSEESPVIAELEVAE
jgi:hypothetical protein